TRPRASTESGLRNIAYALLSGADGWMFDGEDALGQVDTMSLDNQRNLQLAIAKDPRFLRVAEKVSAEMNHWAQGFFGRPIVADAMVWDPGFVNPNIDAIGMTYGYMRNYEDRVRRAVNTPDRNGRRALWQGGMEPNIPVGSAAGVAAGMRRAKGGGEREQLAG